MRGITEQRLKLVLEGDNAQYKMSPPYINAQRKVIRAILDNCEELNPWQSIETAPKDRKILLFDGEIFIGQWWLSDWTDWKDHERIVKPTHWMELPEPPK